MDDDLGIVGPEQRALAHRTAGYVHRLVDAGFTRDEAFQLARDFHRELWVGVFGAPGFRLEGVDEAGAWLRAATEATSSELPGSSVASLQSWRDAKPSS